MNVMSEVKAEFIANQIVSNPALSYEQHAQVICPQVDPSAQRQSIYQYLQKPIIQAKIAEKSAKIHSIDELKQVVSKRIEQFDKVLSKDENLPDNIPLLGKEKDYLEMQLKAQGAFIERSINININADRGAISTKADALLGMLGQGRGEANTGDSTSLT